MLPAHRVIGHKEYGNQPPGGWPGRKTDPVYDMNWRRQRVAGFRKPDADIIGSIRAAYDRPVIGQATWAYFLGDPKGPEVPTWDKVGRWQEFDRGVIMWHPTLTTAPGEPVGTAHVLYGAILERFWQLGAEPVVGYPITDERATPDLRGRYNHFAGGRHGYASIYWSPETWAHPVWGWFREEYERRRWELGDLGYPTSGEYQADGTIVQDFQGGRMVLLPDHVEVVLT